MTDPRSNQDEGGIPNWIPAQADLQAAARAMRIPARDIRHALDHLRGPVDRDEAIVMACAQAILWELERAVLREQGS